MRKKLSKIREQLSKNIDLTIEEILLFEQKASSYEFEQGMLRFQAEQRAYDYVIAQKEFDRR